jgi:hypothetical protein
LVSHTYTHFFKTSYWKKRADNLTKVITGALKEHGGLFDVDVTKLISFGANGVNVF